MRRAERFDRNWDFWLDRSCGETLPEAPDWQHLDLPHDWQIWQVQHLYQDGTGWYRKRFDLTPQPGMVYAIAFDGVYMDTTVYLNGKELGQWKNGYTPFHLDMTAALQAGENELLVRCCLRHPNSRWYAGAGIFRSVELWTMPETHLIPDGLYISAREGQTGEWTVEASAELGGGNVSALDEYTLSFSLLDQQGAQLDEKRLPAAAATPVPAEEAETFLTCEGWARRVGVTFSLSQPRLWSPDDPSRYRIRVSLLLDGAETDHMSSFFGCRTFELTTDKGLYVNHRHVTIHGVCMHQDLGCLGIAYNSSAARRQLELLREMGVNSIRTGHSVPARELMELADEMGMLVDAESFDCWVRGKNAYDYGRFFRDWYKKDLAAWIRRDRNCPSLLFWSIGNEVYDTHAGPEGMDTLRDILAEVHRHDPLGNGAATFGSNYMPWENTQKCADIIKVVGYNYGERCYEAHHQAHPDWVIYGSETGSIVQSRGVYHFPLSKSLLVDDDLQCSSLGNSRTSWGAASLDACFQADREYPYSLGQYLWSGMDYIGEPTPYHTKNSYFGMLDTAGFPKDAYYTCQAGWLDPKAHPTVHLLPYWDFNEGQKIDLCAVSNAAAVELWVNGVSLGRKTLDPAVSTTASWQVPYAPGTVEAAAYDEEGNVVARDRQRSFGDSAALRLASDRTILSADGRELAFLTISAVDRAGNPVRNANDRVTVHVSGGVLVGLDNGDSTDYEEYKTSSRRLFSGLLLAVVAGNGTPGKLRIQVTAPGLEAAECSLDVLPCEGAPLTYPPLLPPTWDTDEIPVRKLELTADRTALTPEHPEVEFAVRLRPENASYHDLEWRITDDGGITAANASLELLDEAGTHVRVRGLGDGSVRVRCSCKNGKEMPQIISQLELEIQGMGQLNPNPYDFITGSRYDESFGDVGNGNERGVSTSRTGRSWVAYCGLDFGRDGSDTVDIPIFELAGLPVTIRFWKGIPDAPGSEMIGERVYHKPTRWNVYQPETFHLDQRLTGLATFGIELGSKVHIKGFQFQRQSGAWERLWAVDCDMLYGDSYHRTDDAVEEIGNNVSLVFRGMDFGERGFTRLTVRGRTALENNTIHVCFDSNGESQRRILEFTHQPDWGEQTFDLEPVYGMQDVTFLFLPGSSFDFKSFQFE
ncbi:MAG: DUF4982 domain-containing protein [Clostridiales bacterium]|nr:DUF4982 domain-containing protein [Clostridiales bacterium]